MPPIPDPLPEYHTHAHNWTLSMYREREERDFFILDAPYQRQSAWDVHRRQAMIKSLILSVPVGAVVYAEVPHGIVPEAPSAYMRVIDGKQRIETIQAFWRNEFAVPGWWFRPSDGVTDELRETPLVYWDDLPGPTKRFFENSTLPGLEFNSFTETTPNPDPKAKNRWLHRRLTNEEALKREAELYLLVNFGGVEQTEVDRDRATEIAGGEA